MAMPMVLPMDPDAVSIDTADSPMSTSSSVGEVPSDDVPFAYDETCIIFDWDDTLLSSSWLAQNGLRLDSPDILPAEVTAQLSILEDAVTTLLERALRCGPVIIITNAETGWVELSCKKFIPRVQPYLHHVSVLSARSTFEAMYPDSPSDWKVQAFFQEICRTFSRAGTESRKNVLSFGDSVHERAAILKVTSTMGVSTRTKSIKFVERPTVEQLKRQIDLVSSCFDEICRHTGNLDLMLTIQLLMG